MYVAQERLKISNWFFLPDFIELQEFHFLINSREILAISKFGPVPTVSIWHGSLSGPSEIWDPTESMTILKVDVAHISC